MKWKKKCIRMSMLIVTNMITSTLHTVVPMLMKERRKIRKSMVTRTIIHMAIHMTVDTHTTIATLAIILMIMDTLMKIHTTMAITMDMAMIINR